MEIQAASKLRNAVSKDWTPAKANQSSWIKRHSIAIIHPSLALSLTLRLIASSEEWNLCTYNTHILLGIEILEAVQGSIFLAKIKHIIVGSKEIHSAA